MTRLVDEPLDQQPNAKRGWRWVQIILALSLVLNVCILGGVALRFTRSNWHEPDGMMRERRMEFLARRIGVEHPEEFPPLQRLRHNFYSGVERMRQENERFFVEIWGELGKASPDGALLRDRLRAVAENRRGFQNDQTELLVNFLVNLNQDQRNHLIRILTNRADPSGAPMRLLMGY